MHLGITYEANEAKISPYGLVGYVDSNYAGNPEDCKSVMEHCFFINGAVVSWCSKKQRTVSTSTTKAEFVTCRA